MNQTEIIGLTISLNKTTSFEAGLVSKIKFEKKEWILDSVWTLDGSTRVKK